jgi:hypothetical protein
MEGFRRLGETLRRFLERIDLAGLWLTKIHTSLTEFVTEKANFA